MWNLLVLGLGLSLTVGLALEAEPVKAKEAAEPVMARPACGKQNRGEMWPPEANGNSGYANRLAREGALVVCQKSDWRYGWKSPSVHVRQLAKRTKRPE